MNRYEALEKIKEDWNNAEMTFGDKVIAVSETFYASGLDLASTAAYIKATPAELDSFLELGGLDEDIISQISEVNPPKTTWTMLTNASDEEITQALKALKEKNGHRGVNQVHCTFSEFVYEKMLEISGPTIEQKVGNLSGDDLKHLLKKGEDFGAFNDWGRKFLSNIARQKKRGKVLTDKQVASLIKILNSLVDKKVISKKSIDGDQDICDRIFEALDR